MNQPSLSHDKISPTAKLVACFRKLSDIPFSDDVAILFEVEQTQQAMFRDFKLEGLARLVMAPLLEIRYKCISHYIKKHAITQVLEFASGIALRGLAMTKDPHITYVETDLPGLTEEKIKLARIIMDKNNIKTRDNLFFHNVNILNYSEIAPCLKHFEPNKPIAIVHEGLFQYLTMAEKALAAKNIHKILKQFGGVWITPDLELMAQGNPHGFEHKQFQPFIQSIEKITGRNFEDNAFKNDPEMSQFFAELGFAISFEPQMSSEIILSSLPDQSLAPEVLHLIERLRLAVLKITPPL